MSVKLRKDVSGIGKSSKANNIEKNNLTEPKTKTSSSERF
jgi:hypothetical protein